MSKRVKTLLLPYLIWNIIYDIPCTAKDFITGGGNDILTVCFKSIINLWFWTNQTDRLPEFAMTTPIDPPLWFVRDLFVCMLLSGILYKLLRKKVTCFLLLGALFVWWMSGKYQYLFPGISVPAFFFFGFGSAIGIWKIDLMNMVKRYRIIVIIAFSGLFVAMILTSHYQMGSDGRLTLSHIEILNSSYIVASIPAYLLIANRLTKYKLTNIERLATASFTLYACHWLVLDLMRRIICRLFQGEIAQGEMMLMQFALYIIPCLVAIALYDIIKRNRRLKLLLSGGR